MIELVGRSLKTWQRKKWACARGRAEECGRKLAEIQSRGVRLSPLQGEKALKEGLASFQKTTEKMWRQKSREVWLKEGDSNTKLFHAATLIRRKRNYIGGIKNDEEEWLGNREEIGNFLTKKYRELFSTENPEFPEGLERLIQPILFEADKSWK